MVGTGINYTVICFRLYNAKADPFAPKIVSITSLQSLRVCLFFFFVMIIYAFKISFAQKGKKIAQI